MQVSATLIAAQQAAREAQAKFQAAHVAPSQASFTAALEKTTGAKADFSPLPLKQMAPEPARATSPQQPQTMRLGTLLDITI